MPLTLFSGRGLASLAFLRGMAPGRLPSSDACRKKAMIVAVAVVVIAGELVLPHLSNHIYLDLDLYPYLQLYSYLDLCLYLYIYLLLSL